MNAAVAGISVVALGRQHVAIRTQTALWLRTQWYSDRHTLFKHSPAYLNQSADESSMITSVVKLTNLLNSRKNAKNISFF